ncbi:hypothetical protein OJAV_G00057850 [Oryzias javanicus]|uniref:Uncharacterized protein n=1 Tax=Oryzias javanicus TaxID=123683 RepID=A0A437DAZ6_ORYJA|nr:hypothetical protein OJAV_G00057850 [Oryzias javanicus]
MQEKNSELTTCRHHCPEELLLFLKVRRTSVRIPPSVSEGGTSARSIPPPQEQGPRSTPSQEGGSACPAWRSSSSRPSSSGPGSSVDCIPTLRPGPTPNHGPKSAGPAPGDDIHTVGGVGRCSDGFLLGGSFALTRWSFRFLFFRNAAISLRSCPRKVLKTPLRKVRVYPLLDRAEKSVTVTCLKSSLCVQILWNLSSWDFTRPAKDACRERSFRRGPVRRRKEWLLFSGT